MFLIQCKFINAVVQCPVVVRVTLDRPCESLMCVGVSARAASVDGVSWLVCCARDRSSLLSDIRVTSLPWADIDIGVTS